MVEVSNTPPQRKQRGPQKQHQNLFGGYIDAYCSLLGWDQKQLAERAGITYSTLNKSTQGRRRASRRTLQKVWLALVEESSSRGGMALLFVSVEREQAFFHAADHATDAELEKARTSIISLRQLSGNQSGQRF